MDRRYTALVPRGTPTRVLDRHPSFPDGLPAGLVADPRPRDRCGDCEVIEHAISIGLDVEAYVELQWAHRRARHPGRVAS